MKTQHTGVKKAVRDSKVAKQRNDQCFELLRDGQAKVVKVGDNCLVNVLPDFCGTFRCKVLEVGAGDLVKV